MLTLYALCVTLQFIFKTIVFLLASSAAAAWSGCPVKKEVCRQLWWGAMLAWLLHRNFVVSAFHKDVKHFKNGCKRFYTFLKKKYKDHKRKYPSRVWTEEERNFLAHGAFYSPHLFLCV